MSEYADLIIFVAYGLLVVLFIAFGAWYDRKH